MENISLNDLPTGHVHMLGACSGAKTQDFLLSLISQVKVPCLFLPFSDGLEGVLSWGLPDGPEWDHLCIEGPVAPRHWPSHKHVLVWKPSPRDELGGMPPSLDLLLEVAKDKFGFSPSLVVANTCLRLMPVYKPTSAQAVEQAISAWEKSCRKHDCAFLGVLPESRVAARYTHDFPLDRWYGSVVWNRESKFRFHLEPLTRQAKRNCLQQLYIYPPSGEEDQEFELKFEKDGQFTVRGVHGRVQGLDQILAGRLPGTEISRKDLMEHGEALSLNERRVNEWITEAIEDGRLRRISRGVYVKPLMQ